MPALRKCLEHGSTHMKMSVKIIVLSFVKKGRHIVLLILTAFVICMLILMTALMVMSPGKPQPFIEKNGKPLEGSISEKIFVDINGIKQGMFIKGKAATNPILLYLHGGMPEYFLTSKYPAVLEDFFTVVWWEQRGSGISYNAGIPSATMTLEQMIDDTKEVTNYLRRRFGREKIFIMGHSGGTFIGMHTASQAPDLYYAYIGVAQMSNQLASEKLAYEYMLQQFKTNGNRTMVKKLETAPVTFTSGTPCSYLALRDQAMHSLGIGTTHDMRSVITGVFIPSLTCREYTFIEKVHMWHGKARSGVSLLWGKMLTTDLCEQVPKLAIPVYFFHGIYDYTVSYTLAKNYFEKLEAPVKGFYTFKQSAHSPLFEEPEKARRIIQTDVIAGANALADRS